MWHLHAVEKTHHEWNQTRTLPIASSSAPSSSSRHWKAENAHCKQAFLSVYFCVLMGILTLPFVWSPFSSLAVKIRTSSQTRSSSKPNRRTRQYSSYYRQNHRDPFCRILCHALITQLILHPSTALFTTAYTCILAQHYHCFTDWTSLLILFHTASWGFFFQHL